MPANNPYPRMPVRTSEWNWIRGSSIAWQSDGSMKDTGSGIYYWSYLVQDSGWGVKVVFQTLVTSSRPFKMTQSVFNDMRDAGATLNTDGSFHLGTKDYALTVSRDGSGDLWTAEETL